MSKEGGNHNELFAANTEQANDTEWATNETGYM